MLFDVIPLTLGGMAKMQVEGIGEEEMDALPLSPSLSIGFLFVFESCVFLVLIFQCLFCCGSRLYALLKRHSRCEDCVRICLSFRTIVVGVQ